MCGIVGFVGKHKAAPILLESLAMLEYRGYDSAGLAVRDGDKLAEVVKAKGKLVNLAEKTDNGKALAGNCGIGHTRWATHGEPSQINAHPHVSGNCTGSGCGTVESEVVGVHNGIIENYLELKAKLEKHGYVFYSNTDTEVVIKLIDYYYKKYTHTCVDALARTMIHVKGTYALEVMFTDHPNEIWLARKDSPMIIGTNNGESFIASDVPAILKHTRNVYYIDNLEVACVTAGDVHFFNLDGDEVKKESVKITWDIQSAQKGGYEYFMMKEIHEQPDTIRNTMNTLIKDDHIDFSSIGLTDEEIKSFNSITIVGCGSAWHTGVVNQYVFEDLAKIPVRTELASEFRYRNPILSKDQLIVLVSQSGETADTLAALRLAKEKGVKTLAIVNVMGSSIAREADYTLYTKAGPEISAATTKVFSAQLIVLYCLAIKIASLRELVDEEYYIDELKKLPIYVQKMVDNDEIIQELSEKISNLNHLIFIGRGIDYAIALEGSLKLKQLSYIPSEAYAAGELKHGPLTLIEKGKVVIGVLTQEDIVPKTLSNLVECKVRGAQLIGIVMNVDKHISSVVDHVIEIPHIDPHFAASLGVVPFQLLAYYVSVNKGLDVDKPRNLAKSVTVE